MLLGTEKRERFGLWVWLCNGREDTVSLLVPGAFLRTTGVGVDGGATPPPMRSIVGERRF